MGHNDEADKDVYRAPLYYRVAETVFDRVFPHTYFLLWPFKIVTRLISSVSFIVWLFSNEYTKRSFGRCGVGVRIYGPLRVTAPKKVSIGDNVHINRNAFIRAEGGLSLGSNIQIASNLVIYTMNHDYNGGCLPYDAGKILKPVTIGNNVWIGMNVIITPGVTVGDGAIIGMGSVIAKDVPPLTIVGSAPQRSLKMRDKAHYEKLESEQRYGGMSGYPWRRPYRRVDDN